MTKETAIAAFNLMLRIREADQVLKDLENDQPKLFYVEGGNSHAIPPEAVVEMKRIFTKIKGTAVSDLEKLK